MLKQIQQIRKRKRQAAEQNAFEVGYGHACVAVLHLGVDVAEVEAQAETSSLMEGQTDSFDRGMQQALIDLEHLFEDGTPPETLGCNPFLLRHD